MVFRFVINSRFVAVLSVCVFLFWGFFVVSVAPNYQAISGFVNASAGGVFRGFAMLEVLFPVFWIILIVFVGICFVSFRYFGNEKWLFMLLVGEISLILFFTPFLLGGFSWSPDSLWHGGAANYFPDILSGSKLILTHYAQSYPFSFLTSYIGQQVLGIGVFNYTLYVYPVFCIVIIAELAYVFASRMIGSRLAFLAVLMTFPSWHYFEGHVSPFSFGTILVFGILILLTSNKRGIVGISLLSMLVLIVTHPISPVALGVFLFSAMFVNYFLQYFSGEQNFSAKSSLLPIFLFLVLGWFSWTVFQAMNQYEGVEVAVRNVLNFNFINKLFFASSFTVGNDSFIIPEIHQLSIAIYGILFVVLFIGGFELVRVFRKKADLDFDSVRKTLTLSLAGVVYALMAYLLFLSSGERFLLGRGLLFFLLMGFMVIVYYFSNNFNKVKSVKKWVAWLLIIFLFCSFPVISYSKEAYNTFTPSAKLGLEFIGENMDLSEDRSISMAMDQQLASFVDLNKNFTMVGFPFDLNSSSPDIVVFRVNAYFMISMRYDLSFDDNRYTQLRENVTQSGNYNRIYANPDFEVYVISA